MSNERNTPRNDSLVSETYHELATERTPDALNERVLQMATRAGRTRYSSTRAWMRPMAWAATIGLSLAFVLQLTELPQPDFDATGESAERMDSQGESMGVFEPRQIEVLQEAADMARAQAGPNQEPAVVSDTPDTEEHTGWLCPADVRETAEGWFECITEKRKSASPQQLAGELEAFRKRFPQFELPATDK